MPYLWVRARPKARNSSCPAATTRIASTSASPGSSRSPSATSNKVGEQVLIIGVGNTAMDCCRSSLRLGAKNVKVMARKPRQFFKASEWELEDAEHENVEIVINHAPKAFVVEGGKLTGMMFEKLEYDIENGDITATRSLGDVFLPCDDVILAIGQENAFPWIEKASASNSTNGMCPR
jgi:formate dehydrogenase beta subunit